MDRRDHADDIETMRDCRVCHELNSFSSHYCRHCGASMARHSGAAPLLARIVTDALVQLADVGLDETGRDLQHALRETATALATWDRRPPEEDERAHITERAVSLSIAAGEYSATRRR